MMKMTKSKRILSLILCTVLLAAMTLIATGCGEEKTPDTTVTITDGSTIGEGETSFTLTVTDQDGNTVSCTVNTDKTIVGDALIEHGLLAGDEGPYGLYIKTINGITADYDVTGTYWAFYIGGEYAATGADMTEITAGETYSFKVES